jgi:hypothetical protein
MFPWSPSYPLLGIPRVFATAVTGGTSSVHRDIASVNSCGRTSTPFKSSDGQRQINFVLQVARARMDGERLSIDGRTSQGRKEREDTVEQIVDTSISPRLDRTACIRGI